jgi:hypothetical protein
VTVWLRSTQSLKSRNSIEVWLEMLSVEGE